MLWIGFSEKKNWFFRRIFSMSCSIQWFPLHFSLYLPFILRLSPSPLFIVFLPNLIYFLICFNVEKLKKNVSSVEILWIKMNKISQLLNFCKCWIYQSFHLFLSSCQIHHNLWIQQTLGIDNNTLHKKKPAKTQKLHYRSSLPLEQQCLSTKTHKGEGNAQYNSTNSFITLFTPCTRILGSIQKPFTSRCPSTI